ncbi:hypothetical protein VD17_15430 [Pseudomonas fluorescens]|uniref:Uncharacterized protein n=1 Tax=Pseudomonas fluorescens TaxID=294 RepID=A0A0F4V7H6_PSEFL|nr:hypothetical protein VD17_15430 [Pseudomonas fluorescens]
MVFIFSGCQRIAFSRYDSLRVVLQIERLGHFFADMYWRQLRSRVVVLVGDNSDCVFRLNRLRRLRLEVEAANRAEMQGLSMRRTMDNHEVVQVNQQWNAVVGHADSDKVFNADIGIVVCK